jgi:hypothetical protein
MVHHELSDIGTGYLAAFDACEVGNGPGVSASWIICEHGGSD